MLVKVLTKLNVRTKKRAQATATLNGMTFAAFIGQALEFTMDSMENQGMPVAPKTEMPGPAGATEDP
jgi:hypothetical protein